MVLDLGEALRSERKAARTAARTCDVAVIGAGVFGAWTAYQLCRGGKTVALLDAYGPANSRASSSGESRIIRMGYGPDEIYTRSAIRSLALWKDFFRRVGQSLFHRTGVLWLAPDGEPASRASRPGLAEEKAHYVADTAKTLEKLGVAYEKLSRPDLEKRFPQFDFGRTGWGLFEPESGALLARRAVQAVVKEARRIGAVYYPEAVLPPAGKRRLASVATPSEQTVSAGSFVFACGPWLGKLFPELLADRIFPTRQPVFFLGVPAGSQQFAPPAMPAWIDLSEESYGLPDLESRGVKVGLDRHGPAFDPDTGKRVPTAEELDAVRQLVDRRLPALRDAPIVETRICQYENTSNGDFLIDQHPELTNVWLVGGGSGHGFKHGPAVGEYVARRVTEGGAVEPRFSLASKATVQKRAVY